MGAAKVIASEAAMPPDPKVEVIASEAAMPPDPLSLRLFCASSPVSSARARRGIGHRV